MTSTSPLMRSILALAALLCLVTAGSAQVQDLDLKLVERGKAEAEILWRRGFTLDDRELDSQLQEILDSVTANREIHSAIELKVHTLRSPDINAFAMPDGSIYVFVGLLGALDSWDQVAFILAHEAEHAIRWHAQKYIAQAKAKAAAWEILSLGTTVALGTSDISGAALIHSFAQLGLSLATAAAVTGYGRDLEWEADNGGLQHVKMAGYDACAPAQALRALLNESDDQPGRVTNFFWGSHPLLSDRIESVQAAQPNGCESLSAVVETYVSTKRRVLKMAAELWLDAKNYRQASEVANDCLVLAPDDAEIHFALGEVCAASSCQDSLRLAMEMYREALSLGGPEYRLPYRGLAVVSEALADTAAAIRYLDSYLAEGPRVPNRRAMKRKLETLKADYGRGLPESPDSLGVPKPRVPDLSKEDRP